MSTHNPRTAPYCEQHPLPWAGLGLLGFPDGALLRADPARHSKQASTMGLHGQLDYQQRAPCADQDEVRPYRAFEPRSGDERITGRVQRRRMYVSVLLRLLHFIDPDRFQTRRAFCYPRRVPRLKTTKYKSRLILPRATARAWPSCAGTSRWPTSPSTAK